ncbi:NAD(P)-dependent oxidoreductase [Cognatishimia sp. MH4019]|uniref:NAD(P)-dependent oxidoreductase n=1 Tax=Cognatishimia sp. MH4019 TaxID=2854030 RepID=UPI002105396F|nr:NAD(P)-binding domain-containing protein [Cognatishimia sp. MH4019]
MGHPMLAAMVAAGLPARGYDLVEKDSNLPITTSPTEAADGVETLVSVVRDDAQTDDVLFGRGNFIASPTLRTIVISSTLSPKYVRSLRARVPDHIALVDAPMSGAVIAAQEARLSFMLGGDNETLDQLQPLFEAMGAHQHRMGPFGNGAQAKVLNNLLAAGSTAMTRLVMAWAQEAGLNEEKLLHLIETSSGQNWLASGWNTIEFAQHGFEDDNSIGILVKDINAALDALPEDADTALPEAVRQVILKLRPVASSL